MPLFPFIIHVYAPLLCTGFEYNSIYGYKHYHHPLFKAQQIIMVSLRMPHVPDGHWKVVRWVIRWTGCMIINCLEGSASTIWLINPGK